jgi:integration host factor subunit alpha
MSLTKRDIIKKVALKLRIPQTKSKKFVDDFFKIIKQTLQSGDDVLISGFGKFCVKKRPERKGNNPKTKKHVTIPARRLITFRCSPKLRDKIQRYDRIASMGVDPDTVIELIDFANNITPPNWIIYESCSFPELKTGNLYIEVQFANNDSWLDRTIGGVVDGGMRFMRISDIATFDERQSEKCIIKGFGDFEPFNIFIEILEEVINLGKENAHYYLKEFGDGIYSKCKIEICINDEADDINEMKMFIVHELAHILVARQAAQQLHVWKFPFYIIPNQGLDSDSHGPIFKWAYKILIKRVDKIDLMVADRCWIDFEI